MRNNILLYAAICAIFYTAFLLIMKSLNMLEASGFRIVNYILLWLISFIQVKKRINDRHAYVPFLQVFCTVFFTGTLSFIFFSAFLFIYALSDPLITKLLINNQHAVILSAPSVIILFEGTGASIIIALINMVYFTRYEEGEVDLK
jgi:hypothetical protein